MAIAGVVLFDLFPGDGGHFAASCRGSWPNWDNFAKKAVNRRKSAGIVSESLQYDGGRQDLRQENGGGLAPGMEQVGGHAVAAVGVEQSGDLGVAVGPVPLEVGDAAVPQGGGKGLGAEGHPLVGEAGDAPVGGEVDEHWLPGGE